MHIVRRHLPKKAYKPINYCTLSILLLISILLASRPIPLGLDDDNYLIYFNNAEEIFSYYDGYRIIFNEPIWLFICYLSNSIFGDEVSLRLIIFFGAAFAGIGLARINRWCLLPILFYFALPMSLKNHVDHLRQGFALGLYMLFISAATFKWRLLRFVSPFVHSSFWMIILIEGLLYLYFKMKPDRTRVAALIVLLVFAIFSIVLSLGWWQVADMLGARQTNAYELFNVGGSGAGFAFWILLIPFLTILMSKRYLAEFFAFLGFYLGNYYINPFAARIFENSYYLLLSGAPTESIIKRFTFWTLLFVMCLIFGFDGNLYPRLMGSPSP